MIAVITVLVIQISVHIARHAVTLNRDKWKTYTSLKINLKSSLTQERNNMKTLAIIAVSFLLSGCFYQTVNQYDLYRAAHFCGSVENIVEIQAFSLGAEYITCKNGNETKAVNIKVIVE